MIIFIQAYRVRVVCFRVRSTPRRPQQNRKDSGGRAAPERLARPKAEQVTLVGPIALVGVIALIACVSLTILGEAAVLLISL